MNTETKPQTRMTKEMAKRPVPAEVDSYIDGAIRALMDIHTKISEDNQKLNERDLDLATDKLGQVITVLSKRNNAKRKEKNAKPTDTAKG